MKLFKKDKKNEKTKKKLMDRAWDIQHDLEKRQERIGKGKYGRVLKMARNPTNEEYAKTSKITGLGILLVGGLGFLIWLIVEEGVPKIVDFLGLA